MGSDADLTVVAMTPPASVAGPQSAISWAAVWAGASVALATAFTLSLAAAGLGYTLSTPGFASRSALGAFTPEIGAGAIFIQVLAFALGGFVAGRLRTSWIGVHADESHFRDTAHGLLTWAVGTIASVLFAVLVLAPYSDHAALAASQAPALTVEQAQRAANIAAQSSLFMALGLFLSAFVAAIAARLGGMEHEAMVLKGRA